MSIDQIAADALRLPAHDRAMLAESLWESLSDPYVVSGHLQDETSILIAPNRDREIETGEVQAVDHESLMARLRR